VYIDVYIFMAVDKRLRVAPTYALSAAFD